MVLDFESAVTGRAADGNTLTSDAVAETKLNVASLKKIDVAAVGGLFTSISTGVMSIFGSSELSEEDFEKNLGLGTRVYNAQYNTLIEVFQQDRTYPTHSSIFCSAYKDRIVAQGRRRGMQFPFWIDTTIRRHVPQITDHTALSPNLHERYIK